MDLPTRDLDNLIDNYNLGPVVQPLVTLAHANQSSSAVLEIIVKLAIVYGINAALPREDHFTLPPAPIDFFGGGHPWRR